MVNEEAIIGKYYWHENGGYYKIINCSIVKPDTSRDFTLMCLWHEGTDPFALVKGSRKHVQSLVQHMGCNWHSCPASGCIMYVSPNVNHPDNKNRKAYGLWNLNDVVHKIAHDSEWDGPDGRVKVNTFGRDNSDIMWTAICTTKNGKVYAIYDWNVFLRDYKPAIGDVGTTCKSCNRDYPYAEASSNFECWGCKNGY